MNTEKMQTYVNFLSFPKFIKGWIMSQNNQLLRIAGHPQKSLETFNADGVVVH